MDIIYKVTIALTEDEYRFLITWHNLQDNTEDSFDNSAENIAKDIAEGRWLHPPNQLEIGRKLFSFLDGDSRHLQRALHEAEQHGQPLQLHLTACDKVADWPFELLAREDTFLLPLGLLHLVRQVSDWGEKKKKTPRKRALKLLFMACSAIGVIPELDFEREEETIFDITESMNVEMDVEDSGSLQGLSEQLLHHDYDVVHLSGHANIDKHGRSYFIMEDETGYPRNVSPKELWNEALINNPPRLLFLSGCRTGQNPGTGGAAAVSFAGGLVENDQVPAVLGWGRPVDDEQAIHAEAMLYRELSRGKTILQAIQRTRYELAQDFQSSLQPAWPLLRLFSSGVPLNQIVARDRPKRLNPRRMRYNNLENSQVRVLAEGFVGRRRQLQRSIRVLKKDKRKLGVLILGAGGLGKSCLAGKIIERFKYHTLIIVHGKLNAITMRAALKESFIRVQDHKGRHILATGKEMADKLAELCATSFKEKNYLILFDDFEQNLEGAVEGQPGSLLPETVDLLKTLLHYLYMSENMTKLIITGRYEFSLTEQSQDLVKKWLEPIRLTGFQESEQHKKALGLVNILKIEDQELTDQLLNSGRGNPRLMERLDELLGKMKGAGIPRLITAVTDKQEEFIREHAIRELLEYGGDELALFLHRLSIFRRPVLIHVIRQLAEKAGLEDCQELLEKGIRLSLIEHDQALESYRVSPLLQEKLLAELEAKEIQTCHEVAFSYYKAICESTTPFDPVLVEEWTFHAVNCGKQDTADEQGTRLVKYLRERLAFKESKRVGAWLLEAKGEALNSENDTLLLNETALTMKELGEYNKAIGYYEKALMIDLCIHSGLHINIGRDLNNLGMAWNAKDNYEKAIEYFDRALKVIEKIPEEKRPDFTGTLLNNLGLAWSSKGDPETGIVFYEQALENWKELYNEKHEKVAIVFNNLGSAYNDLGEHDKAIDYFKKALSINRSVYGELHPETAGVLNNLGAAWLDKKDCLKAIAYFEQALNIWKRVYGERHVNVAAVMSSLASAYRACGKLKKAEILLKKALNIARSIYGEEHKKVVEIKKDLESVRKKLQDTQSAEG